MPKRKSEEDRFVAFAMNQPIEQVRSVINTMKAILDQRSPKAAKATKAASRKPATSTAPPTALQTQGRAAAGSGEGQHE